MVTVSRRTPAVERAEDLACAFREHGFVRAPRLFSEQEVARFRAAAAEAMSVEGATGEAPDIGILGTVNAWENNDTLRGLALHPRLGALAERLAGMPLRVLGGEVLVKRPRGSRPTGLHDDLTAEALDSRISLNAWVALVDVPVERGCMTFFDGSHRREGPERIDTADLNLEELEYDSARSYMFTYWPGLRWTPRVTVPLRAGDVTFHHRRTAHLAGANQTQDDRISMQVVFTDADATYQPFGKHNPMPYQPGQPLPRDRFPRAGTSGHAADPRGGS